MISVFFTFFFYIFFGLGPTQPTWAALDPASPARPLAQASGPAGQNNSTHDACGAVKGLIIIQSYHV
jgi:hypothetical protein